MCFFVLNTTATTSTYTLSLHDALPILGTTDSQKLHKMRAENDADAIKNALAILDATQQTTAKRIFQDRGVNVPDRKSTRLNSSHSQISYAVFCLKKKNKNKH